MPKMLLPADEMSRFLRKRRAMGGDRYDEVWNGVYVVMPLGNNEHRNLGFLLTTAIYDALGRPADVQIFPGCNVSDRPDDWTKNYRCPDVAVYLPSNPAEDRDSHWLGGPDFAVEIVSPNDRARKKFNFYARVGVRELMLVDRHPLALELHRRSGDGWDLVGRSDPSDPDPLASAVLPVSFRLVPAEPRPKIEVARADGGRWLA